jgi:peptidoglycan/LPS O-acetylase OafA/YrhL
MLSTDPARTISSALRGHDNALGLIRLVLALAVLVSHTFPLGGFGHDPGTGITHGQSNLGSLAVAGFFAISGYLITKSGMSADVMQFLWRRVLRIFPAFFLVLLLSAFVLGPVIWTLDGHAIADYFARSAASPWHYIASNWTLHVGAWGILDVFRYSTPYGLGAQASVFNGSTWTLSYEWACYLMVAVLLAAGVLAKARPVVVAVAAVIFAGQIVQLVSPGTMGAVFPPLGDPQFLLLAYPFAIGSVFAVYSRSIPLTPRFGIAAGVVLAWTLLNGGYAVIGVPAGVYFILWAGSAIPGRLRTIGQKNDISYGVYLYAFPVQQTLAYFGLYKLGVIPMILGAAVIVLSLSWLSWRFLESKAMSLKGWGPGRGFAYWIERFGIGSRTTADEVPTPETTPAAAAQHVPHHAPHPVAGELSLPLRSAAGEPASPPA